MSQDQEPRRNQDGEGRGPSAFSVLIWIVLTSTCIVLGFFAIARLLQTELSPTDLKKLVDQYAAQVDGQAPEHVP